MRSLICVLFASALAAQSVCASGEIVPIAGPTICQNGETHRLLGTAVFLRSSTLNLGAYAGRIVEVQGTDVGLLCHVIEVTGVIDPAPVTMSWCGSPMLSCPVKVVLQGPGLGVGLLAVALASGYQALGCGTNPGDLHGTLLLGPAADVFAVLATPTGRLDQVVPIPLDSALVGLNVLFQGAHMTIGPQGPLQVSNRVTVTLSILMPPCAPTNC
ncbi:MAG TPA: hypothetical protein VK348_13400 [Planctomycetota bacterium]|nr:hypothetical protein [Planctomycetota bacterium]